MTNILGNKIRELRKKFNMTQKDLADFLEVSPSAIGMYEQGRRDPDFESIVRLATRFDVSTDYLLGISNRNRIKQLRMSAGLSQAEFGRLFGVDQTAVSNWENGKNNVDIRIAEKISEHFKFPLEFIYGKDFEIANPIENWHPSEIEDYQREIPEIREILLFKKGRGYFSTQTFENKKKPAEDGGRVEEFIRLYSSLSPELQEAFLVQLRSLADKQ